jgi:hypothetical protein
LATHAQSFETLKLRCKPPQNLAGTQKVQETADRKENAYGQPRSNAELDSWNAVTLCSLQQKLNFHSLKRKDNATVLCAVEYSSAKQRSNVAMHSLYVAPCTAGGFANGY